MVSCDIFTAGYLKHSFRRIKMKKSIAVLGLGKYGMSLAKALYDIGVDVLAVDQDENKVKEISEYSTYAICMDLTNEDDFAQLDLKSMDIVVTAMGRNLAASIMSVAVSKEKGVPLIVAKSSSERMSSMLRKIGADKVIVPEETSGMQSARILVSDTILDYFQVDNNLCMIEMYPLEKWVGRSLIDLNLRKKHLINAVAKKDKNSTWRLIDPEIPLEKDSKLLIVVERSALNRLITQ